MKGARKQTKGLVNAFGSDSTDSPPDLMRQLVGARKQRKDPVSTAYSQLRGSEKRSHDTCQSDSSESSSYLKRQCQLPAQCHECWNTDDDDVLCSVCHSREPQDCSEKSIYWVECERCGSWVHSYCAHLAKIWLTRNTFAKSAPSDTYMPLVFYASC